MSSDQTYAYGGGEEEGGGLPEFLLDPIGVFHRRWLPMALCFAIGLLATIVAVIVWKPEFLATATILITSQQIPKDFVRPTVEEDSLANISGMLGEVLSAERLSDVIDRLHLFPEKISKVPRMDLVNQIRSRVTTAPSNRPGGGGSQSVVYEISYNSRDPQEAAAVSNALAALFVEVSVARRNTQAQRTTVFLRNAMERAEKELREQSSQITDFRQAHRGDLPEELEPSLRRLDLLSSQRESLASQITAKEDRVLSISSQGSGATENEAMIGDLRHQLAKEIAIHTDEHPNVIALRERLKRLEETNQKSPLPPTTTHMIEDERREIGRLREQRDRVDGMITELNQRVERIPRVAEELAALQQREVVLRDDYTGAMRKVEAAELAENLESARQGGQVSVLDEAVAPAAPKLSRSLIGLIGFAASIGLAVAVAALLELIDPVVIGVAQIGKLSDRPVLGTVPYVG
jgi:uncharacterized protein involved in exopolysaccharide biosynthesis